MVKCVVCGKKEVFFEPANSAENSKDEKAFMSVDVDYNNKLYMGFCCSESCISVFDATPTAFVSGLHMVADYNKKSNDKKYSF